MSSETPERRIVLLFGLGAEAEKSGALPSEASELSRLLTETSRPTTISIVSLGLSRSIEGAAEHIRLDNSGKSTMDKLLTMIGAYALRAWLARFPLGRLLNSLGPVDQNRVYWRKVRRHPDALALIKSASIAIAADLTSTKTAWLAVHRGWVDEAFYDRGTAALGVSWQLPASKSPPQP